jgi:predicted flavoprotein YhiN
MVAMQVTVLERTKEAGKKILMSGGTRCNVLPAEVDLQTDFVTDSPQSCLRAIFASWGVWECWAWLCDPEHVGLALELEDASNKWFPASNSSKEVRNKLVAACQCVPMASVILLYYVVELLPCCSERLFVHAGTVL